MRTLLLTVVSIGVSVAILSMAPRFMPEDPDEYSPLGKDYEGDYCQVNSTFDKWTACYAKKTDTGFYYCDTTKSECIHKKLIPIRPIEWVGFIIQFVIVTVANAGGIAGGSMLIPLILIFNKFSAKQVAEMTPIYNGLSGFIRFLINIFVSNP